MEQMRSKGVDPCDVLRRLLESKALSRDTFESAVAACEAAADPTKRRRVEPEDDATAAHDGSADARPPVPVGLLVLAWHPGKKWWRRAVITGARQSAANEHGDEYVYDVKYEHDDSQRANLELAELRARSCLATSRPFTNDGHFYPVYVSEWTGSRKFEDPIQWRKLDPLVVGVMVPENGMDMEAKQGRSLSATWNRTTGDSLKFYLGKTILKTVKNWHQHIAPKKFTCAKNGLTKVVAPSVFETGGDEVDYDTEHLYMRRDKFAEVHYIGQAEHSVNDGMRGLDLFKRAGFTMSVVSAPNLRS